MVPTIIRHTLLILTLPLLLVFLFLVGPSPARAETTVSATEQETGQSFAGSVLRQGFSSPDGTMLFSLEGGGETVNRRLGLRLGGATTLYTADKRLGLRLDGAMVQSDSQNELLRLLLSAGSRLGQDSQVVASAGWLNRYAWGNYSSLGDQGGHLNQYVLGLEVERRLRQRSNDLLPAVSASLSSLYFKSDNKTVWSGYQTLETNQGIIYSYSEYGLGGGSQQEAMAGLELGWQPLTLELRAGLRHKEFEEYLGRSSESQDAPKLGGRLTGHDVLGCEFSGFYTWDPDLKVFGGEARRQLWGPLGLVARAEQVSGADRPDDTCYFLGFDLWLGSQAMPRGANALPGALAKAQEERQTVQMRQEAYARGDWLRPVRGSEVEYVEVMRQVQRQTRLTEVVKDDLSTNLSINEGEMVVGGPPPLNSIVAVRPATVAFSISGGRLRATLATLPAPAEIIVQAQQNNGQFSVVRLRTSKDKTLVRVDSVKSASNLNQCSADAILHDPGLISNPPIPLTIGQVPDLTVYSGTEVDILLSYYVSGGPFTVQEYNLSGDLPQGLAFNPFTSRISGRAAQPGTYTLRGRARGSCPDWSNYSPPFTITVLSKSSWWN